MPSSPRTASSASESSGWRKLAEADYERTKTALWAEAAQLLDDSEADLRAPTQTGHHSLRVGGPDGRATHVTQEPAG